MVSVQNERCARPIGFGVMAVREESKQRVSVTRLTTEQLRGRQGICPRNNWLALLQKQKTRRCYTQDGDQHRKEPLLLQQQGWKPRKYEVPVMPSKNPS